MGLDEDIVRDARAFLQEDGARIESLISELKHKNMELDRKLNTAEIQRIEIENLRARLMTEISEIKKTARETLTKAFKEAEEIVRTTKKETREILENLKRSRLSGTGDIAKELDKKLEEIVVRQKELAPDRIQSLSEINEGQRVFINSLHVHGIVQSVNRKTQRCKVLAEGKEIVIPFAELSEPAQDSAVQRRAPEILRTGRPVINENAFVNISGEINVIGRRVDPALSVIERHLNDASVAGLKQIKIIHGIGTGILARAIREYLKDHPLVESCRKGNEDEGGEAVTIAVL
ncbi:MAG: Smr/MutS family protein [Nitrospirae bacterium]|nr:Smr/MutS family protein [Nitrospirota bacterium]